MDVEILQTKRNGHKLCVNGFIYCLHEKHATYIRWKCEEPRCSGRLKTTLNMRNPQLYGEHRHGHPEERVVQAHQLRTAMTKHVAIMPHASAGQIYHDMSAGADPDVVAHLTSGPSSKRGIWRSKAKTRPPLPATAEELVINERYSQTKNGQPFLVCDEVFEGDRMLVFASNFLLSLLFMVNPGTVCMDGTFQMVPRIFWQLFTLNMFYNGKKQVSENTVTNVTLSSILQ